MSVKSFNINKHVTIEELEVGKLTKYNVMTAFGYSMEVLVNIKEQSIEKVSLVKSSSVNASWRIYKTSRINRVIKDIGLNGLFKIIFYLGVDSSFFFKVGNVKGTKHFYVDFYIEDDNTGHLFTDVEVNIPLVYYSEVKGDFKNLPLNATYTLEDIVNICMSIEEVKVKGIYPDNSLVISLLYNEPSFTNYHKRNKINLELTGYPSNVSRITSLTEFALRGCAKIYASAMVLGFELYEIQELRPNLKKGTLPKDVEVWSSSWFELWEYNLQLERFKRGDSSLNLKWYSPYYKNLDLVYSNLKILKKEILNRILAFNRSYFNIQINNTGYSSQNKLSVLFFSIFKKRFIKFLPYSFINSCGLEEKGLYVLEIPVSVEDNIQVSDFESAIISKSGISPKEVVKEVSSNGRVRKADMISQSKEANKYLKREKDGYLFVISRDTDKDWGYKFRVSSPAFKNYLKNMLGSGRMKEYWADIYPFLENINKDGIDYLRKEKPEVLLDYAYKCTKFSGLIQKGNFISIVTKKDMDFSSIGLEEEIREVYRKAVEKEEKQEKERKRLEEIYGI